MRHCTVSPLESPGLPLVGNCAHAAWHALSSAYTWFPPVQFASTVLQKAQQRLWTVVVVVLPPPTVLAVVDVVVAAPHVSTPFFLHRLRTSFWQALSRAPYGSQAATQAAICAVHACLQSFNFPASACTAPSTSASPITADRVHMRPPSFERGPDAYNADPRHA